MQRETSRKWLNVIAVDTPGPWLVCLFKEKKASLAPAESCCNEPSSAARENPMR